MFLTLFEVLLKERLPVYFAQSEFVDRSVVRLGSVALVLFKAILRIFLRHLLHVSVPGHLRQNGRKIWQASN
mgnify:CR=1 FL=1